MVQKRQELNETLGGLQQKIMSALAKGSVTDAGEVLGTIAEEARSLDRMNFDMQLLLSQQLSGLLEGLESIVTRGKTCLRDVDATHQQVHVLQALTESELRQHTVQEHAGPGQEIMMHKQVQELEGDLKALQEELSASQMLRRECLEDVHGLQRREEELEAEIRERNVSQNRLTGSLSRLQDELWEARQDIQQHPCAVRVVMDIDYEDTVANSDTKAIMDMQLQEDISIALKIQRSQVEVLCYTRGLGTMAEVKISPAENISTPTALRFPARALAEELQRQVADEKSDIHFGPASKRIKEIEVHGPIESQTARALRSALLESDGVLARTQSDLVRVSDKLAESGEKHRAAIRIEEENKLDIIKDCDERLRAASADFQNQIVHAIAKGKEQTFKEQEALTQRHSSEHEAAMDQLRVESRAAIAELTTKNVELDRELRSIRDHFYSLEANSSSMKEAADYSKARCNNAEKDIENMRLACKKVDEVLIPELSSCLITLNNIESEMGFMHAHSIRTLTLISSDQKSSSSSSLQDAQRSKEVGSYPLALALPSAIR